MLPPAISGYRRRAGEHGKLQIVFYSLVVVKEYNATIVAELGKVLDPSRERSRHAGNACVDVARRNGVNNEFTLPALAQP